MTTNAQDAALAKLTAAKGQPVVLHVGIGSKLVAAGKAVKLDSKGHGKLMAAYRVA